MCRERADEPVSLMPQQMALSQSLQFTPDLMPPSPPTCNPPAPHLSSRSSSRVQGCLHSSSSREQASLHSSSSRVQGCLHSSSSRVQGCLHSSSRCRPPSCTMGPPAAAASVAGLAVRGGVWLRCGFARAPSRP